MARSQRQQRQKRLNVPEASAFAPIVEVSIPIEEFEEVEKSQEPELSELQKITIEFLGNISESERERMKMLSVILITET